MADRTDWPDVETKPVPEMRASRLLKVRAVWLAPVIVASLLIVLMTVIYIGSVVDPSAQLHGLPVLVVNEDAGATVHSQRTDIGRQVVSALRGSTAVSSRLSLDSMTLPQARKQLDRNAAYAAIVIPTDFTASVLGPYAAAPATGRGFSTPTIRLLTNVRSGSVGVSLATSIAQPALVAISNEVGARALARAGGSIPASATAFRGGPIAVTAMPFRPLPSRSALGLSAFYISLLTLLCGFLGAVLVNSSIDAALGYASNEVGTKWQLRAPVPITRWQTLLAKWIMAVCLVPILTGLLLIVAIAILNMNASHVAILWLFTSLAAIVVAGGVLVLFAALGSLGQVVAMLVFIYLALASSGGTIPLQALPGVLRFAAHFEPLRQILDGVRAILYFNAAGDAGLTRGLMMTCVGLVFWLGTGIAITLWYDRKGMYRMQPELLAYINASFRAHAEESDQASRTSDTLP